jgi:hypothetical protein
LGIPDIPKEKGFFWQRDGKVIPPTDFYYPRAFPSKITFHHILV